MYVSRTAFLTFFFTFCILFCKYKFAMCVMKNNIVKNIKNEDFK